MNLENKTAILLSCIIMMLGGCQKDEITGLDDLSNPAIQPKVIFTNPDNGGIGPFNIYNRGDGSVKPHFVIRFNKLIDRSTVTSAAVRCQGFDHPVIVQLMSAYYYYYIQKDERSVGETNGDDLFSDVLSFRIMDPLSGYYYPSSLYRIGSTYTVTIDSTVRDINGNRLSPNFALSFTPEPVFRVVLFTPKDGATDVPPFSYPSLVFNSPVGNDLLSKIQISPSISGYWYIYLDPA